MTEMESRLQGIAAKLVWHKQPKEALSDTADFLCRVMNLGSLEDVIVTQQAFSKADFIQALQGAAPGILSTPSWNYWHLVLGMWPPPPPPQRRI